MIRLFRQPVNLLVLFIVVLGFLLRVWAPENIYFNIHAERDLWRALQIMRGEVLHYTGSELTMGGRTPGPALYLLSIPPLIFTKDPSGVLVWLAMLHAGAIFLTYRIGREHFSCNTGLMAAALFATFPLAVLVPRYLWNPSFLFPLSALFYWSFFDLCFKRRMKRLPIAVAAILVMLQVHLSAALFILVTIFGLFIAKPKFQKRSVYMTLAIAFLLFLPYLVGEAMNGAINTRRIINPPERLETANLAELPILEHQRKRLDLNVGSMKALQVVLSPVLYDMRFTSTGNFSYLHLIGEHAPVHASRFFPFAWLLHQLRWFYVGLFFFACVLFSLAFITGKDSLFARLLLPRKPSEDCLSAGRRAAIILLCFACLIFPMMITTTTATLVEGERRAIGAIRYFFILYPLPFIALALVARAVWNATTLGMRPRYQFAAIILVLPFLALFILQSLTCVAYLRASKSLQRTFKYATTETIPWYTIKEASRILTDDWGVTPEQFRTRVETLDFLFDSRHWDQLSIEQGMDWAMYIHPGVKNEDSPRFPDDFFVIADTRRNPDAEQRLADREILDIKEANGLLLFRVRMGTESEVSPIQNTWVRIR